MLKENLEKSLNEQLNSEIYSAYLYLSMAAYCDSINLKGFANWFKVQTQEELFHAMKFYDYIIQRGGKVILSEIKQPPIEWESVLEVFIAANKHEQLVTNLINNLVSLAFKENDHATYNFLQWFISEQVEEEASTEEIANQLKMIENSKTALYMLDKELSQRTFTLPTTTNNN